MTAANWGTMFDVLSNEYRRRLLVELLDHNPRKDTVGISEDVPAGGEQRERLRTEMFHRHLPKLEDSGYIRWDRDSREVVRGPEFAEIRPLLEVIHANRDELPEGWI